MSDQLQPAPKSCLTMFKDLEQTVLVSFSYEFFLQGLRSGLWKALSSPAYLCWQCGIHFNNHPSHKVSSFRNKFYKGICSTMNHVKNKTNKPDDYSDEHNDAAHCHVFFVGLITSQLKYAVHNWGIISISMKRALPELVFANSPSVLNCPW